MSRFVFGLNTTMFYGLPDWKIHGPKLLKSFDNDVLFSAHEIPTTLARMIYESVGKDRLKIDSGGYTLYKKEATLGSDNPEFHKKCESTKKKLLKMLSQVECKEVFELDNEYFRVSEDLLDPANYCRNEIKELTGFYPTPVFKMHQGFEYWEALCKSDYPKLAIGGLAPTKSWHKYPEELKTMMEYARIYGKEVHLLGCQNVEAFKIIQPDAVDYLIYQYNIVKKLAKSENPNTDNFRDLGPGMSLWAVSRAMARSFLYDCYAIKA